MWIHLADLSAVYFGSSTAIVHTRLAARQRDCASYAHCTRIPEANERYKCLKYLTDYEIRAHLMGFQNLQQLSKNLHPVPNYSSSPVKEC
jgi:hypothetical protein